MQESVEDYTRYGLVGLLLTLLVMGGLAFYTLGETNRLASAAAHFNDERIARGEQIYRQQCVACHGAQGEGVSGPALKNRQVLKNTLDSVFFSVVRSGVPGTQMPAWSVDFGGPLTDEDVRDVVAFLRSWEPDAPEIAAPIFTPDPARGARLFASTCAICHGENGGGSEQAPRINDPARLQGLPDEWYRGVIRNGRPAKGMPTWGTVLSPDQIEDLVALVAAWRAGQAVQPDFAVADLLAAAAYALEQGDPASARLQIERATGATGGAGLEVLRSAAAQIDSGDLVGALKTLQVLQAEWPLGDANEGAAAYSAACAACHGLQGQGALGPSLVNNVFVQGQSNADLLKFIQAGRTGTAMAGFKQRLSEEQIANIIAFLRLWQSAP